MIVAEQLGRKSIGIEIDSGNVKGIKSRLEEMNHADDVTRFHKEYIYTENLKEIWNVDSVPFILKKKEELSLFKL